MTRSVSRFLLLLAPVIALGQPVVNSVVNAFGYQAELAPGAVFTAFGAGLGPASLVTAPDTNYQESLGGTSVSFTPSGGGAAIAGRILYTLATAAAGLLPSSTAPGTYAVRVTYNGQTSAAFPVRVVARSFGIAAANSAGSGPAQATIGDVNGGISLVRFVKGGVAFGGLNWVLTPAHPGETVVLWGTGGGADAANDRGGTSGDQTAAGNFAVLLDGRTIVPAYAGASSGYPGLWQVNFKIPADATPGCYLTVQVSAGGVLSNEVTIAVAASGAEACTDSSLTPAQLAKLAAGGTITAGAFAVLHSEASGVQTTEYASGGFFQWTATEWAIGAPLRPDVGRCGVSDRTYPLGGRDPAGPSRYLDGGDRLPLTGPGLLAGIGLVKVASPSGPNYLLSQTPGTFRSGRYGLTGNGGPEVGSFSVAANYPAAFTVTNWDAITGVNRGEPLTFNWTSSGVDTVAFVIITAITTPPNTRTVVATCLADGKAGTFTVPVSVLARIPPSNVGSLSATTYNTEFFTAPLTAGGDIDFGSFGAGRSVAKTVPVR